MDIALPKMCPVLGYDNPSGLWRCQRRDEDIWTKAYEALKELGWWSGWCMNAEHTTCQVTGLIIYPDYLGCPLFSRWFWEKVAQQAGEGLVGKG